MEERKVLATEMVAGEKGLEPTQNYDAVSTEELPVEVDTKNGEMLKNTVPPKKVTQKDLEREDEEIGEK